MFYPWPSQWYHFQADLIFRDGTLSCTFYAMSQTPVWNEGGGGWGRGFVRTRKDPAGNLDNPSGGGGGGNLWGAGQTGGNRAPMKGKKKGGGRGGYCEIEKRSTRLGGGS
jgi:hypothetical protein